MSKRKKYKTDKVKNQFVESPPFFARMPILLSGSPTVAMSPFYPMVYLICMFSAAESDV